MSMPSDLSVRPGVYFTAVQGEGVIMDLAQDRYYGLATESTSIWQSLQLGMSHADIASTVFAARTPDALEQVDQQLQAWTDAGLLTPRPESADDLPRPRLGGTVAAEGLDAERLADTRISSMALLRLARATWSVRRALTHRGPGWAIKRVQAIPVVAVRDPARREAALYRALRTYHASRRLISQGKDDCLPRSLALAAVLRRIGVDAEICFGVRKFPFLAHAWLQAEGMALNEAPRRLAKYALLARF
jgi:hypothetical protein